MAVYIHLDRLQAEVDALIARRSSQFGLWRAVSRSAPFTSLLRGTAVRVLPEVPGVLFNPPSQDLVWLEELQEVSFRLQAEADVAGRVLLGPVGVYVGPLLVGQIPLSIRVRGAGGREEPAETLASTTVRLIRRVSASYAHEDDRVVGAFAEAYRALGIAEIYPAGLLATPMAATTGRAGTPALRIRRPCGAVQHRGPIASANLQPPSGATPALPPPGKLTPKTQ